MVFMAGMETAAQDRAFMSVSELAAQLDVSPQTVHRLIRAGHIPAFQVGGPRTAVRIPVTAVRAYLGATIEDVSTRR
jgi:excisionase family DNA binding protein